MPRSVSCAAVSAELPSIVLVDVRKDNARAAEAVTIPGSLIRRPFSADSWWQDLAGREVVVFCAHGHEVSQAVCGFLADMGVSTRYLEGGLGAWRQAGLPLATLERSR